ncbi:MAG TPA: penicillin-binding protein [Oceanithermus profundus]|uniref:Penicillin-binding protein n=1 Tax=Oceanithermus profundus TaxID=187137 RepID=A0A7C5WS30_9DEIN|nr:penicillin-binding protein [Oceanithermus profundus]
MPERVRLLLALVYFVLLLLVGRLVQLQVFEHGKYATLAKGNHQRTETIPAPRGRIFDRNGTPIAANRIAVDLYYRGGPVRFASRILTILGLERLPEVPEGEEEVVLAANLPDAWVPTLAELTAGQPNLRLEERIERYYPNPIAGPVIGYVQGPTAADLKRGYERGDLVGRAGLEAALEETLRGRRGLKLVEVDVRGEVLREQVLAPPVPGRDVRLTLDLNLQRAAERALAEALADLNAGRKKLGLPPETVARGAIVAVDPTTGEVLAMATAPAYDPNLFTRRPTPASEIRALQNDPALPLLNRAVQAYTPGSTFKPVTASALLEAGLVSPATTFRCLPSIRFGGQTRRNWSPRDMGPMKVTDALAYSCNTWFYQAVIEAGPVETVEVIADRARALGLGAPTGLEIAEKRGLVPDKAWKRERFGEPWYPGETLSVAIGQGPVLVTPAQLARAYAALYTGRLPELHLVEREVEAQRVPGRFFGVLRRGLRKTVTEGTARSRMEGFPVPTAGKTGTAETPGKRAGYEHAWYAGFGPWPPDGEHRPLVAVAFVENGGEGSRAALPVVKRIMAAFWGITGADARPGNPQGAGRSP